MVRTIDVKILGRNFRFDLPTEIHPRTFMEIIAYVEDKIRAVRGRSIDMDSFRLGLLTSINIAAELFSLRRENDDLRAVLRRIDKVIATLDNMDADCGRAHEKSNSLQNPLSK
ncbi:MAG TPA: cell division protein ZapA [Candidatus Aminicenantes bacterium]|nr:cell division protein ZapA [Candidatus Aminicenantes bacterium]